MLLHEFAEALECEIVSPGSGPKAITGAYTSDLLSDVMANARDGDLIITIQAHKNTVAVAGLVGASGILVCNGRTIPQDMIEAARDEGLPVMRSRNNQFYCSGLIFRLLESAAKTRFAG